MSLSSCEFLCLELKEKFERYQLRFAGSHSDFFQHVLSLFCPIRKAYKHVMSYSLV